MAITVIQEVAAVAAEAVAVAAVEVVGVVAAASPFQTRHSGSGR